MKKNKRTVHYFLTFLCLVASSSTDSFSFIYLIFQIFLLCLQTNTIEMSEIMLLFSQHWKAKRKITYTQSISFVTLDIRNLENSSHKVCGDIDLRGELLRTWERKQINWRLSLVALDPLKYFWTAAIAHFDWMIAEKWHL